MLESESVTENQSEPETPAAAIPEAEEIDNIENLRKAEDELTLLIMTDKKGWVATYRILQHIETHLLWQKAGYRSFANWIRGYSQKQNIAESLLWHRKQAGNFYSQFIQREADAGREVKTLEQAKIPPDSLNLIERIAKKKPEVADNLITKLLDGQLKRRDLNAAWKTTKAEAKRKGSSSSHTNQNEEAEEEAENKITATQVVLALSDESWLPAEIKEEDYDKFTKVKTTPLYYRALSEFAVRTGQTSHARRIDVMVAENYTINAQDKLYRLNLHGIEIKVDKHDLLNDQKMTEYAAFADYSWLAVPTNLLAEANNVLAPDWGLIAIGDDGKAKVIKAATKQTNQEYLITRQQALMTFIVKSKV